MPDRASRRTLAVAALLVVALLVAGVSYVRIADSHAEPSWSALETDRQPEALLAAVQDQLHRVDHRTVTRIWRVDNGSRELRLITEEAYDFSDAQYVANYAAVGNASKAAWAQHHTLLALLGAQYVEGREGRVRYYADDRRAIFVRGAGPVGNPVGNYRVAERETIGKSRAQSGIAVAYQYPFFLDYGADWTVADRQRGNLTLVVDDPGDVLGARTLFQVTDVHDGTRLEVVLDGESGRPLVVRERRVVSYEETLENGTAVTRRATFVVETTFRDYGAVDVAAPPGAPPPTLVGLVRDFLA